MSSLKNISVIALFVLVGFLFVVPEVNGQIRLSPEFGVNKTKLSWAIAADKNGGSPNVLSELKWTGVRTMHYGISLDYTFRKRLTTSATFLHSSVSDGAVNDRDFRENNRTGIISERNFPSSSGAGNNAMLNLGYVFTLFSQPASELTITPLAHFLYHDLNLEVTDPALNRDVASYKTKWAGAGGGVKLGYNLCKFQFNLLSHIVFYEYRGTGNWKLRKELQHPVSFKHQGNGYGYACYATVGYTLNNVVTIKLGYSHYTSKMDNGDDILYKADNTTSVTRLNYVKQQTNGLNVLLCLQLN